MALLSPLYNLPNHVLEKQKLYQNDARPLMKRGPRGALYFGAYTSLFAVGMLATGFGAFTLIRGKTSAK